MTGTGSPGGATQRGNPGGGHPDVADLWLAHDPEVLAHLSSCPACEATLAQHQREQDAVSRRLRSLGQPDAIPAEVRDRLHRAIRAEARQRASAAVALPHAPQRSGADRPAWRMVPSWLVAASVIALLVLGGSVLVPLLRPGGDDSVVTAESASSDVAEESLDAADLASSVPAVPDELVELGQALASAELGGGAAQGRTDPTTCGAAVAEATDSVTVASTELAAADGGGVLVVTTTPSGSVVWWLPDCAAGVEQALGRSLIERTPAGMSAP